MQTDLFTINFSAADDTDAADFIFFSACDKDLGEAPLKIRVIRVICGWKISTHINSHLPPMHLPDESKVVPLPPK